MEEGAVFEIFNEPEEIYSISNLIYKQEAYDIISCCFEVHNALGKGFLESVYKDALMHEFKSKGICFERERKFEINYKGITLSHYYFADFLIDEKIILEVKAQHGALDGHAKQVINYLRSQKAGLAYL